MKNMTASELGTIAEILEREDFLISLATTLKTEREAHTKTKRLLAEKNTQLADKENYLTVRFIARINGVKKKAINKHYLNSASERLGYGIRKTFDAVHGHINAYHRDVWQHVYPELYYDEECADNV